MRKFIAISALVAGASALTLREKPDDAPKPPPPQPKPEGEEGGFVQHPPAEGEGEGEGPPPPPADPPAKPDGFVQHPPATGEGEGEGPPQPPTDPPATDAPADNTDFLRHKGGEGEGDGEGEEEKEKKPKKGTFLLHRDGPNKEKCEEGHGIAKDKCNDGNEFEGQPSEDQMKCIVEEIAEAFKISPKEAAEMIKACMAADLG